MTDQKKGKHGGSRPGAGRPCSEQKQRYIVLTFPMPTDPVQKAALDWWQHRLKPEQRLELVSSTKPCRSPMPRRGFVRSKIPTPVNPTQQAALEKWQQSKPHERLETILALFEQTT